MKARFPVRCMLGGCVLLALGGLCWLVNLSQKAQASPPWIFGGRWTGWGFIGREGRVGPQALSGGWYNFPPGAAVSDGVIMDGAPAYCGGPDTSGVGGTWLWMRSPEQERVVISGLFNRYCIRCHGVDGRGIWDIPGVPDFTNKRWQATRSDDQIARIVIEGRGAVMPTFRGTLTIEEAWAMARYLRTFVPGAEASRPNLGGEAKTPPKELPAPKELPPTKGKKAL